LGPGLEDLVVRLAPERCDLGADYLGDMGGGDVILDHTK
jgi:hypothetical protein